MYSGFVVLRLPSKSGATGRRFRCLGVKRNARTACRRGPIFGPSLYESRGQGRRVRFRFRVGCGAGFGCGLAAVSVARCVGCRYSGRNRVSVTLEMVPVTPRTPPLSTPTPESAMLTVRLTIHCGMQ